MYTYYLIYMDKSSICCVLYFIYQLSHANSTESLIEQQCKCQCVRFECKIAQIMVIILIFQEMKRHKFKEKINSDSSPYSKFVALKCVYKIYYIYLYIYPISKSFRSFKSIWNKMKNTQNIFVFQSTPTTHSLKWRVSPIHT